jgi:hypothetical protein
LERSMGHHVLRTGGAESLPEEDEP